MDYYDTLFEKIDRDQNFLKKSILNHFIVFDEGYDPFLMSPYEQIHRKKMKNLSEPVKNLYNLNISYAYKLIKTKNLILELRSMAKPVQNERKIKYYPET